MLDLRREVARAVHGFVGEVIDLARVTPFSTLGAAFELHGGATEARPLFPPRRHWRGVKRTRRQLTALAKRFATFVQKNPGLRIEQISHALGTTTRDLILPVRNLVQAGQVKTAGETRWTTYYANTGRR